jgi:hypothetical protein
MKFKQPETVTAWTWEMKDPNGDWRLCLWAEPFKAVLLNTEKPVPDARPVCVRMIRNGDWKRALK